MISDVKIADIPRLLANIPSNDLPLNTEEYKRFWMAVAWELEELLRNGDRASNGEVVFNSYRKAGDQYIWEFYVNDLSKDRVPTQINFHGQNTSQWLYAGAIKLENGKVSMHH